MNIPSHFERKDNWLIASICSLFVMPLSCALINYYFVKALGGTVLCALYYGCLAFTYINYSTFVLKIRSEGVWLLIFLLIYCIMSLMAGVSMHNVIFMIPIMLCGMINTGISDIIFHRVFRKMIYACFMLTALLTIRTLLQNPGAARVLASKTFVEYGFEIYRRTGCGGFDFIYSIVMLIPLLIAAMFSRNRWNKAITIATGFIGVVVVFLSGYTTAMLLTIASIALMLFINNRYAGVSVSLAIMMFAFIFVSYRIEIANWLVGVAESFSSQAVEGHIIEIANILTGKESVDDLDRFLLYQESIDAFGSSPLFGTILTSKGADLSNHSTFLDLLGGYGLIGFIPYAGFLIAWYIRVMRKLNSRIAKATWRTTTCIYYIFQMVNPIFANYLIIFVYMAVVVEFLVELDKSVMCQ